MSLPNRSLFLALALFFFSGVTALIYEVLWLRELSLLFGNSSQAMATTLAAFFFGIGLGGQYWGNYAKTSQQPLRLYAMLEFGVAIWALGYYQVIDLYAWIYPYLFTQFGAESQWFLLLKFSLSVLLLLPATFFMGGTLPIMSRYVVANDSEVGEKVAVLYGVNTLGAMLGVFLASFYLPSILGYNQTYLLAIGLTMLVACIAYLTSRELTRQLRVEQSAENSDLRKGDLLFAFASGVLILALQVLWARMFAQVLQNSIYTYAIILMAFLFSLAVGSLLVRGLLLYTSKADEILFFCLLVGGMWVAATPQIFLNYTDGLHFIGADLGWRAYVFEVVWLAIVIMVPPLVLLGMVFPILIKLGERQGSYETALVGHLLAANTAGAVVGSLMAGFIILDQIGLWSGIRLTAVLYLLLALAKLNFEHVRHPAWFYGPALGLVLAVSIWDSAKLSAVRIDPVNDQESLLELWEGSGAHVAVVQNQQHRKLKLNNYYTLGGSASLLLESLQARLPMLLHEHAKAVYILGLGTGITAGAVTEFNVDKVVVTELVPEVVAAAEKYFSEYNNNIFFDPRVSIVAEDGRNYLRATDEQFDVIISDLFVPWKAGAGSLYTQEHYQNVAKRLHEDGLFMQWLPAYQLSEMEFHIILQTMATVFPQVTLWRGDFSALRPIVGLLGQKNRHSLSSESVNLTKALNHDMPLLSYYIGSFPQLEKQITAVGLNTDDKPLIEFASPQTQRQTKSGQASWLVGEQLLGLMQHFDTETDYYLSGITAALKKLPLAGLHLQTAQIYRYQGKLKSAKQQFMLFRKNISLTDE